MAIEAGLDASGQYGGLYAGLGDKTVDALLGGHESGSRDGERSWTTPMQRP